jgi:outer membrane protein TolC
LLEAGKVAELDVLRAEVQLADGRQRLVSSENGVALAYLRLRNAVGLDETTPLEVEKPGSRLVVRWQPLEWQDDLLTRAYAQRPEILAAQAQVARFRAERRQAAAGLKPEVRAVGTYYREGASLSLPYDNWYAGVRASLPLFDGQATRHAISASEANVKAAEADLETVKQRVRLEVHDAWLSIREAAERLAATQAATQQAQRALEIEQQRYKLGMNTMLDVLDTQTALTGAQYNHIGAYFAYHTSQARLRLAAGEQEPLTATPRPEDE